MFYSMKKASIIIVSSLILLLLVTKSATFASKDRSENEKNNNSKLETIFETKINPSNNKDGNGNEKKSEIKIKIKIENEEGTEENEIRLENNQKIKIQINKNRFEIRGIASDVSSSSFVINGQLINIDPAIVKNIHIRGSLINGAFVQTEGVAQNGMLFAQNIKVKSNPQITPSVTEIPSITPSITPTTSPTATPSVMPTITPETQQFSLNAKIKGTFTLGQLAAIFEEIINTIKTALGAI